jgi:hypothetical protein
MTKKDPQKQVVLAEYFISSDSILLFVIRSEFKQPEVIPINRTPDGVRRFVSDNFSETLNEEGQVLVTTQQKIRGLSEDKFQEFFEPFITPLLSKSSNTKRQEPLTNEGDTIWFVPHDILHYVPLHAIKLRDNYYLIDRNPICYSPSASIMKYCKGKRTGTKKKRQ